MSQAKKMSILFFCSSFPNPNGFGAERRAWSHLLSLSQQGAVDVIVLKGRGAVDENDELLEPAKSIAQRVTAISLEPFYTVHSPPYSTLALLFRAFFCNNTRRQKIPDEGLQYLSSFELASVYDVVFCTRIATYTGWRQIQKHFDLEVRKTIVDSDDVESVTYLRTLRFEYSRLGKVRSIQDLVDIVYIRRLEAKILREADVVTVCSELDRKRLEGRRGRRAKAAIIPNTANLPDKILSAPSKKRGEAFQLLCVGTMSYPPNADGAHFLVETVLPVLREQGDMSLHCSVVGFNPPPDVVALGQADGVEVTGGVDDLVYYYQRAHVAAVPIRFGGGTRIKILEAMAYGRPVVSTTIGAEGLDVTDGHDILIADTPEAFAAAIEKLWRDDALWQKLVGNGRALIEAKYSATAAAKVMQQLVVEGQP